jgi:hypothetical protein
MFQTYILQYTPFLILLILLIFSAIKLSGLKKVGRANRDSGTFFRSFFPHSRMEIRNAGDSRIQNFLKKSNEINNIMYIALGLILGLYLFVSAI